MNNKQATFNFKKVLLLNVIVVGVMLAMSGYVWTQIPAGEQVPVHFDANGTPDRYGSKAEGLLLLPAITAGMALLFVGLPRLEPRRSNLLQSQKAYQVTWIATSLLMLAVHVAALLTILGFVFNFGLIIPILVGLMLIVIGNFMGKMRSTWFMGIRTPWTLTSELSWNKTHRLGGRMFMLLGLLIMLTSTLNAAVWAGVVGIGSVVMVLALYAYSYFVWKNDPATQQS